MDLCCCSVNNGSSLTSFEDVPEGLVFDILSRLPPKSVLQSICVCKLWCFIIKTPTFISAAHSHFSNASTCYTFLSRRNSPSLTVISEYPLVIRHPDFTLPFQTLSSNLEFIGACNGLICVTDSDPKYRGRDIYVTNPFIRKYKKLGVESSCYADFIKERKTYPLKITPGYADKESICIYIGFGYCEVEDDYKVLRIIQYRADTRVSVNVYKVEVYSLKHGKWRALDLSIATELAPNISPTCLDGCTFVHGCLYWRGVRVTFAFAADGGIQAPDEYLLCFDLKHELFSRIELPEIYFGFDSTCDLCVTVKNGSLVIVLSTTDDMESDTWICLFVLEKKSGGQIKWKQLDYERANFHPKKCIGSFCGGRLIFLVDSGFQQEHIVAVDLDNSCAIERLALSFPDGFIDGSINVSESLVLLSD